VEYATPQSLRAALDQRLKNRAKETGLPVARLRKYVVFERLLARLAAVNPEIWVLKGGLALDFRYSSQTRTTKDIDLVHREDEAAATRDLIAVQAVDLGDHFSFAIEKRDEEEGSREFSQAVKFHVRAELASAIYDEVTIDVGFSDPVGWHPDIVETQNLLEFAGAAPIQVPVLPLEQQVAEKVHAYTRIYTGDRRSGRAKDLVDLLLIKSFSELDASRCREALEKTFDARGTHRLPASLPPPPPEWRTPFAKLAEEVGVTPRLDDAYTEAARFIDPVLAHAAITEWVPVEGVWR
jgi:hypothetical protein